jgi:hypothetical protein
MDEVPEPETWLHTFRDGSKIEVLDMEDPIVTVPRQRFKKQWAAEVVRDHILDEGLDTDQSIEYITKQYDNEN